MNSIHVTCSPYTHNVSVISCTILNDFILLKRKVFMKVSVWKFTLRNDIGDQHILKVGHGITHLECQHSRG